ncbi:membrane protein [Pyrenophora tritici-repentis]|nr:membrane protein [Pyrenophora tritici-repentis]KAI1527790.1 membrane protein [Pyrenophora tritici-repentis]KAI1563343.1 membrane protein [Pyrenophora tritici-repentis]KAI2480724.1 membrane protein [Pyrenophora tritici-repentis]PZC90383.1 membrane protein [Pyrenophora tritici-repentis]
MPTAAAGSPNGTNTRKRNTALTPDERSPICRQESDTAAKDYNTISSEQNTTTTSAPAAAGTEEQPAIPLDRTASAQRVAAAVEREEKSAWSGFWEKYGSVELDNKGSVARDHLALERTFLAWLRTSLSFASIGIAITQLFRLNTSLANSPSSDNSSASSAQAKLRHLGKPLGATFIGISIVMLLIGFHRYFEAQHYVIRGKFPASRGSIIL